MRASHVSDSSDLPPTPSPLARGLWAVCGCLLFVVALPGSCVPLGAFSCPMPHVFRTALSRCRSTRKLTTEHSRKVKALEFVIRKSEAELVRIRASIPGMPLATGEQADAQWAGR